MPDKSKLAIKTIGLANQNQSDCDWHHNDQSTSSQAGKEI
jgi:hypothetical protein